jgi:ATP-dependent Clp protease ATP-binding subunit ClpB
VLEVAEPVVEALAREGYEPEYGARPLRRVLRRRIENPLATALLEERFSGAWGVRVEPAAPEEDESLESLPSAPLPLGFRGLWEPPREDIR